MADHPPTAQTGDDRIDTEDSEQLERWSKQLGISRDELLSVIAITGNDANRVTSYVREEGSPGTTA